MAVFLMILNIAIAAMLVSLMVQNLLPSIGIRVRHNGKLRRH